VPTFARAAWEGRPLPVWGDGEQTMDLVHTDDVARMLIEAVGHGDDVTFDAGTGQAVTVNELAAFVLEQTGSTAGVEHLPMRPGERPTRIVAEGDGWDRLTWKPSTRVVACGCGGGVVPVHGMSDVAVISAVYDHYDDLKLVLPQSGVEVDWVFVTDDPAIGAKKAFQGWRVVYEPRPGVHPNRAAKHPKYEPWKYTDAPVSLWVDASFRVVSDRFAVEATAGLTEEEPIAQFAHPWRDCRSRRPRSRRAAK
jgi:hypothetical protein